MFIKTWNDWLIFRELSAESRRVGRSNIRLKLKTLCELLNNQEEMIKCGEFKPARSNVKKTKTLECVLAS